MKVAVIGAGILGLATARALRERGAGVRVYERGLPGAGQSAGEARIFRHAHDDPRLVALAREGRGIWREWEADLGIETVSADGVLAIGENVADRAAVLAEAGGVEFERPDPAAAAKLLPPLAEFEAPALFDPAGGAIRTRAIIERLTADLGDDLRGEEVLSLRVAADGVEVRSATGTAVFDRVVVAAGIRTAALAHSVGVEIPVQPAVHLRLTFALREAVPGRLPCFQDGSGIWGEAGVYASPQSGNDRYAVGLAGTTPLREDGAITEPDELAGFDRRIRAYVERALPGLDPEPLDVVHCWVTELPWGEDAFSVWQRDGILFPCGHNLFKQAPKLGRMLAAAATGEGLDDRLLPESRLGAAG